MKVELILNDDIELRNYIKQLINNEIVNIAREQIIQVVNDQLDRKVNNESTFNHLAQKCIKEVVEKRLRDERNSVPYYSSSKPDFFSVQLEQMFQKEIVKIKDQLKDELVKVIVYMLREGT